MLMTTALTSRQERWVLLTLAGVQLTHILDFMVMMPLGPQFTELFRITDAQFGALVSAYALAAAASGLMASAYLDRMDRKQLLLGLYLCFTVATVACATAQSYQWLMAARIAAGLFGGVLAALSSTIVGDLIPFERRGRAMGVVMASFSVSTVAGVPIGLALAARWGWHAPFWMLTVMCAGFMVLAAFTLPAVRGHLNHAGRGSVWTEIWQTLSHRNHQWAFALTTVNMFAGFVVIPYITIYMRSNVGLSAQEIPYLYLAGGLCTLVTARWIGRLADTHGKAVVFRWLVWATPLPLLAVTHLPQVSVWVALPINAALFVALSGRIIPAMAILTSAAQPQRRGTFMALNASVQSMSMGAAAFLGGLLISRDVQGQVVGYGLNAAVGCVALAMSLWLVNRVIMHQNLPPAPSAEQ
jgi:predicted MFS family arabinose efflux permease